ncbi:MAG: ATPase domain-containing protein, partial [Thermoplasmata archaeon]
FSYDDINALVGAIEDIVRHLNLKRIVIDSMTAISFSLKTKEKIRDFMLKLGRALSESGCTVFLISEIPPGSVQYSVFGVEEMIADGVIALGNIEQRGYLLRTINVVKMRGTVHSRSKFVMDLTPHGIIIVPLLKTGL